MVSALAVVGAQLLPDALAEIGLWGLLVFALAMVAPTLLEKGAARLGEERGKGWGLELGYAALIVHKLADGVGLGTYASGEHADHLHLEVFVAIAAHTVPVVALVAMAYYRAGGVRAVILRSVGLAVATVAGVFL